MTRHSSWEKESPVAAGRDYPHPRALEDVGRCVLLTRGDDVPAVFLAALERAGIEVFRRFAPFEAFHALIELERKRGDPSGWGLPRRPRTALVVADRDRWGHLEPLLSAVRRHLPDVALWVSTADLWLEVSEPPRVDAPEHSPLPDLPPTLRLAKPPAEAFRDAPRIAPEPDSGVEQKHVEGEVEEHRPENLRNRPPMDPAVTPEEIEMLLRFLPPDERPDRPGGGS
jgi:hypothetical protein